MSRFIATNESLLVTQQLLFHYLQNIQSYPLESLQVIHPVHVYIINKCTYRDVLNNGLRFYRKRGIGSTKMIFCQYCFLPRSSLHSLIILHLFNIGFVASIFGNIPLNLANFTTTTPHDSTNSKWRSQNPNAILNKFIAHFIFLSLWIGWYYRTQWIVKNS